MSLFLSPVGADDVLLEKAGANEDEIVEKYAYEDEAAAVDIRDVPEATFFLPPALVSQTWPNYL